MNDHLPSVFRLLGVLFIFTMVVTTERQPAAARETQSPNSSAGGSIATTNSVSTSLRDEPQTTGVMFIENVGQWDEDARFQVRGAKDGTAWLANDAIWLTVTRPRSNDESRVDSEIERVAESVNAAAIKLSFVNANPEALLEPFNRLDTVANYFLGNDPRRWQSDVTTWGGVRYVGLYPGIDVELTSQGGQLLARLESHPGANLDAVRLQVEGAVAVNLDGQNLRLISQAGATSWPLLQLDELRTQSTVQHVGALAFHVISPFTEIGSNLALGVGDPEPTTPHLVSTADDPADLVYGTFLGDNGIDRAMGIAVNESGVAYVAGDTYSSYFPTTPGAYDTSRAGGNDAFVLKLSADGSSLIYATFVGGTGYDTGYGIAVDGSGMAYIAGHTNSDDFPITLGAFDTVYGGGDGDSFVIKLNATGSGPLYSTFFGGSDLEEGFDITIDGTGSAYVIGRTYSYDFPATPGAFDTSYNGGEADVFIIKLDDTGSDLLYGTFLGGVESEIGFDIAVDASGNGYITGLTGSSDFPTTPAAFDVSNGGAFDAFAAKLSSDGSNLHYSTFLGSAGYDLGLGVAVDSNGAAYIAGETQSSDFPTTPGAYNTNWSGGSDAFVVKLDVTGTDLLYGTFLGGASYEFANDIVVGRSGAAYLTGGTRSYDFPITDGAFDRSGNGSTDAFVAKLSAAGSALEYSTFVGGTAADEGTRLAVNADGTLAVAGSTVSPEFPTTPGAFDESYGGGDWADAFVIRVATAAVSGHITSPSENVTIGPSTLVFSADAWGSDAANVEEVRFFVFYDRVWHPVGVDSTVPYEVVWQTPNTLRSQQLVFGIHVVDDLGNVVEFADLVYGVNYVESRGNPDVDENWIPTRVYLNQRSLVPNGDVKCSAASMAMLLAMNSTISWDYLTLSTKANEMYPRVLNGDGDAHVGGMVAELERQGMDAETREYLVDNAWSTIKEEVDAGRPTIVRTAHGVVTQYGHFFVAVGYREAVGSRQVIAYDPFGRWLGTCCTGNYDKNTPDPGSRKGQWVFYDFDLAFGRYNWLITGRPVAGQVSASSMRVTPATPPDLASEEPENIGTYPGVNIEVGYRTYLPLAIER